MIITPSTANLNKGDVLSIKLSSSEELVARYHSEDADFITVTYPLAIGIGPNGQLALSVYMFGPELETAKFPLNRNLIVSYLRANQNLAKDYLTRTSKIQLPPDGTLIK